VSFYGLSPEHVRRKIVRKNGSMRAKKQQGENRDKTCEK
jgi:hypothetical protein